jgi:hypothetical protein
MTLSLMPVNPVTDYDDDRRAAGSRRLSMTAPTAANGDESSPVTNADEIAQLKRGIAFLLVVGLIPILIGWLIHTFCPQLLPTELTDTPTQILMIIHTDRADEIASRTVSGLSRDGWFPVDQLQLDGVVTAE